jgi:hypothetical protein
VQAERNTKKAGFFLLPRRRLSYSKIVQAAFSPETKPILLKDSASRFLLAAYLIKR